MRAATRAAPTLHPTPISCCTHGSPVIRCAKSAGFTTLKPHLHFWLSLQPGKTPPHNTLIHGRSPSVNMKSPRNEGSSHSQPAFEVAHLAAGGMPFPFVPSYLPPHDIP